MKPQIRLLIAGALMASVWAGRAYAQGGEAREARDTREKKAGEEVIKPDGKTTLPPEKRDQVKEGFGLKPPPEVKRPESPPSKHHGPFNPAPPRGLIHIKDNRKAAGNTPKVVGPKPPTIEEALREHEAARRKAEEEEMETKKMIEELSHHRERRPPPQPRSCADAGSPEKVAACREAQKAMMGKKEN